MAKINPNADRETVNKIDLTVVHNFPKFVKGIKLEKFRHISNLTVDFQHPISVIAGTNRSGKTTLLMALACSHYDFNKRNVINGTLERHTWSSLMYFTDNDKQTEDWTYHITYKLGNKIETKRGQRKANTKKWNGIGKKESQFKQRNVVFIDLDRITPARTFSRALFNRSQNASVTSISTHNKAQIEGYLSHIFETNIKLGKLASHIDKDIFQYSQSTNEYSSYNAATGEDVISKIIIDIVEAPKQSLILIDEIEVGLHPKVQRKLIEVLYHLARYDNKQFIITSHSATILSSVPVESRIFIERSLDSNFRAIQNISVNATLSKMDSVAYPLVDLYCEDEIAKKVILKAISNIQHETINNKFSDLINVIISGCGEKTHNNFEVHKTTYPYKKVKTGYACILDGDQRSLFASEENLHFLYSDKSPEYFLIQAYLIKYPHDNLQYHLENSDNHCLLNKMVEFSLATSREAGFEKCWEIFLESTEGDLYFRELIFFINETIERFSKEI